MDIQKIIDTELGNLKGQLALSFESVRIEKEKNKKLSEALQKIDLEINKLGLHMVDIQHPLQMALYTIKHLSKEALKTN